MTDKIDWYHDFIDFEYNVDDQDLVALFYYEKDESLSHDDIIGRLASESSIGTWTTLETLEDEIYQMRARSFWRDGNFVKIAYPLKLWEEGNMPQVLSGVAGNIFGMKAVKNLRLIDIKFPTEFVKSMRGPNKGPKAFQDYLGKEGPLTSCVPKPKLGLNTARHIEVGLDAWTGGIDCIKDDENLTNQSFNRFHDRVEKMAIARDKAESETGDKKDAFINVTAETKEMERRVRMIHDHGFKYFMVDVVTTGYSAVQTMADLAHDFDMAIHAHRAMHATFTKHMTHGMNMYLLAKIMRLIGVDNIHIGTVVGKLDSPKQDVIDMKDMLLMDKMKETGVRFLDQDFAGMNATVPTASGGLHPGTLPEVLDIYNTRDMALQVGGGIHGHPDGTHHGAKATIAAIDAWKEGITLEEKAKSSPALAKSLEKFGYIQPV
ncbi:MAG: type III ribulose-bisphosphate carboxylase [Candidatus Kariarchaeaceae archaeon]